MSLSYLEGRHNVHSSPWTDERVAVLKTMWGQGYSASDIARELGNHITRSGVIGKVHRLKLGARKPHVPQRKPRPPRKPKMKPPPQPQPPQPLPREPVGPPNMRLLTLMQLEANSCRWPVGNGPFLFCGEVADGDHVYCAYHQRIAFVPGSRRT